MKGKIRIKPSGFAQSIIDNIMAEEMFEETEVFTLTDEDGNESDFELIATYDADGVAYVALEPLKDNEAGEYVVLRIEKDPETDEEILVTIDDDEEFDKIADIFDDMLFEDDGE